MDEEKCEHHFVKGAQEWEHDGLWMNLILTIFCEKCGKFKQIELDRK